MRKNSMGVRVLSLLLALAMVLSLCGCSGGRRPTEPAADGDINVIEDQTRPTISSEEADKYMHNDPAVAAHIAHNKAVDPTTPPDRQASEFHVFVTNTETMKGFVDAKNQVTDYLDGLQSAFTAAHEMYQNNLFSHSMVREGSGGLHWGEAREMTDLVTQEIQAPSFYEGNVLPADGALAPLFRSGETPFQDDALTLIVTNFVEPRFDLNSLTVGIEKYFDEYTQSAACIIGFTSYFEGNFHIPQHASSGSRSTFFIENFKGEVPYYMVVVGPEADVKAYTEKMFKHLDTKKVSYSYEHFSNNVYEEHFSQPLVFDVIPDVKAQKLPYNTPFSYNTGTLTEHAEGSAYFATYANVETRDGTERKKAGRGETEPTVPDDAVKISNSSQIALISRNYDGVSSFQYETALYVYNKDTKNWQEAGKNAELMVNATLTPVSGEWKVPVVDKEYVILADAREEMYAAVQLDFGTDDILSRDEVYRLEMKIHLNQEQGSKGNGANGSGLSAYNTDNTTYYAVRDDLARGLLSSGDYRWTALYQNEKDAVTPVVGKTPNLESLLISLRQLEGKYKTHTEMYTYLDFVFNIREKGAGGRRG